MQIFSNNTMLDDSVSLVELPITSHTHASCTRKDGTEEFLPYSRWQVYDNKYLRPDDLEGLDGRDGPDGWGPGY